MSMKNTHFKKVLSLLLAVVTVLSCWVWVAPEQAIASAANESAKDKYLFAYFTGTSKDGQTIHLAVSEDGYNYTALRNNEPVIVPSKGVGNVRDPYIWYNEQDNYYYILATDLDFTDGGGTYSNNSQSFIVWRSKDLVNWYDETMIDVAAMSHLIGDTRNMSAVWAPQVLWDGSAYVIYFTLACNATSWFDIVYLKTTDIMDPDAYYEFDYILGNSTGNGTDNGYGVIDADIIHNPGDGKYYLFYKTETNGNELGTTSIGSSLKTIHYYVGDTPTGPFTNPGDTKWSNCGFSVFPDYTVSLEGCNSFFDNDGNLIMYADEFEHTNSLGEVEAYFHIAKSNGYDFTSWSYPDVSKHNINSLSPRHGSVVKITTEEYNRLLNNSYNISSSSFPADETLSDHLVARYFTTTDPAYNAVEGKAKLSNVTNISMLEYEGSYAAFFNSGYAEVNLGDLFTEDLNYQDGFTITFNALMFADTPDNSRIYEIADSFGSRTGTEHYTHMSASGGGNGTYIGNYNGPANAAAGLGADSNDWLSDINGIKRNDLIEHEYIISYANGNVIMYVDGEVAIMRNRFNGVPIDDAWYKAIGNSTMRIGKSGWDADPLLVGYIQNLCIYDCSMSYYDAQSMNDEYKEDLGWVGENTYTGITSVVPTFQNTDAARMQSLPNASQHFSNILYTSETVKNYDGNNMSTDSAAWHSNGNDFYFALYYPETTVLLLDGINDAIMPVSFGAYCENSRESKGFLQIYPTTGPGSTADNGAFEISQNWGGWYNNGDYYACIVNHADGYIGRNSTTSSWSHITDKKNYDCHWGAPLKVNGDKIDFGGSYYKMFNLTWQVNGGADGNYAADHSANMTSDNDIYVIDFRPILELRSQITEADYNEVMNNAELCPELRQKYAAAVFGIQTINPAAYNYAANPEFATKSCSNAIGEAVSTYEGVMAEIERQKATGSYGHSIIVNPAREATCSADGLTEGRHCSLCGEIFAEQQTIPSLPHTFGNQFTDDGVNYYVQCSVCGQKVPVANQEVRYENLFSLNNWIDSTSYTAGNGTVSANPAQGTITLVNTSTTSEATTGGSGPSVRTFSNYSIPVEGSKTYVLEYLLTTTGVDTDIYIFTYNKAGTHVGTYGGVCSNSSGASQNFAYTFTTHADASSIELRFDTDTPGGTAIFANIGVYTKESYDLYASQNPSSRLPFSTGESKELYTPKRIGYEFLGWYTSDGQQITNTNQLTVSTTVYAKWRELGYSVNYNGNLFSLTDFAKSNDYKMQGGAPDGHVYADFASGTFYTVSGRKEAGEGDRTESAQMDTYNTPGSYKVPVTAGEEYVFTMTLANRTAYQCYLWFYDANGAGVTHPAQNQVWINHGVNNAANGAVATWNGNTLIIRFTVPTGATHMSFRLGTTGQYAFTQSFSKIGLYVSSDYDEMVSFADCPVTTYVPKGETVDVFVPSKDGYTFGGWYTGRNNTGAAFTTTAGMTASKTIYGTWSVNKYNVTFDNLIDLSAWPKTAGNGTVSNVTDTGFTITSNEGAGEATSTSAFFPVEPGKTYKIDMDVTGTGWDVYIFFCNDAGGWVDFADSTNRYSSNGGGVPSRKFTAPDKAEVVKAQIRVDANGSNNTVTFNNIRVYEDTGVQVSPANKVVTYDSTYGTLPTPYKYGYSFLGWFTQDGTQILATDTVKTTSTLYLNSKWIITNSALASDAYVLDFGVAAEFTPLTNDTILASDGGTYSISGLSASANGTFASTADGKYGTFTLSGNTVKYTPDAFMNDSSEVVYYQVAYSNGSTTTNLVSSITVIPATVVYYEDDVDSLITYTDGKASDNSDHGEWGTVGSSKTDSATQSVSDAVYGYDDIYASVTDNYSMGSATLVTVSQKNNPQGRYNGVANDAGSWPVAEFTFAGTGFDLVSLISQETGSIEVKVIDANGNKVYDWIVDTYYGYTFTDGEWTVSADVSSALYQIPVISRTDLDYGTYTVQVIPTYTSRLDHQKDGSYDFYLDAIRVYNPCGTDVDASSVYATDSEYVITHTSVRDILINAGDLDVTDTLSGVVYINPGVTEGTFEQYSNAGPKNEVYLAKGQSVAFNMTVTGFVPTSVQVSAHAINGTASMRFGSGSSSSDVTNISHKTTLYYEMPFMTSSYWTDNGDGTFTTTNPIVITNNGEGLLSLCNIKVSSDGTSAEPVMFTMSRRSFALAAATADNISDLSPEDEGLFVPENVEAETDTETAVVGDTVTVTVTTSADVAALTVNGEDAVLVSENEDGTKTWSYSYAAENSGTETFTLVSYNADGYASESTEITVEVQTRFEHFFSQLQNFIKMIVEFFENLLGK